MEDQLKTFISENPTFMENLYANSGWDKHEQESYRSRDAYHLDQVGLGVDFLTEVFDHLDLGSFGELETKAQKEAVEILIASFPFGIYGEPDQAHIDTLAKRL